MCEDFFIKQKSSIEDQVFEKVMDKIESRFQSEDITSRVIENVFVEVMKELKALQLLQEKTSTTKYTTSVSTNEPELKQAKNAFAKNFLTIPSTEVSTIGLSSFSDIKQLIGMKFPHLDNTDTTVFAHTPAPRQKKPKFSNSVLINPKTKLATPNPKLFEFGHESVKISDDHVSNRSRALQLDETYNSSFPCLSGATFMLQIKLDTNDTNIHWKLSDSTTGEIYSLEPTVNINNNFTNTLSTCLLPGIYSFSLFHMEQSETICDEFEQCYRIIVNDNIIVNGSSFFGEADHTFSISSEGNSHERHCHERPLLSPINHLNNFHYDRRVEKIMNVIQTISSPKTLNNFETPQYMAACLIAFDDVVQTSWNDNLILQKYIIIIFLYSMNQQPEIMMLNTPNICDFDGIVCNSQGHVVNIVMSEYVCFV